MIADFAYRHPVLSGWLIALLFTVAPVLLVVLFNILFAGMINGAAVIVIYAAAVQLFLCLKIERPILAALPFILSLIGLIVCEIVYTLYMGSNAPGFGPSAIIYFISSVLVIVFGGNAAGIIGGFLLSLLIAGVRKLWDFIAHR